VRNPIPDYLRTAPLWKVFLVVTAVAVAFLTVVDWDQLLLVRIETGVLFGALTTGRIAIQRRRDHGSTAPPGIGKSSLQIALNEGRLPVDAAESRHLAAQIAHRRQQRKNDQKAAIITVAVAPLAMLASGAALQVGPPQVHEIAVYLLPISGLVGVGAVVRYFATRAQLAQLDALAERLPPPDGRREDPHQ